MDDRNRRACCCSASEILTALRLTPLIEGAGSFQTCCRIVAMTPITAESAWPIAALRPSSRPPRTAIDRSLTTPGLSSATLSIALSQTQGLPARRHKHDKFAANFLSGVLIPATVSSSTCASMEVVLTSRNDEPSKFLFTGMDA